MVSAVAEKSVEKSMIVAYKDLPPRAVEYVNLLEKGARKPMGPAATGPLTLPPPLPPPPSEVPSAAMHVPSAEEATAPSLHRQLPPDSLREPTFSEHLVSCLAPDVGMRAARAGIAT